MSRGLSLATFMLSWFATHLYVALVGLQEMSLDVSISDLAETLSSCHTAGLNIIFNDLESHTDKVPDTQDTLASGFHQYRIFLLTFMACTLAQLSIPSIWCPLDRPLLCLVDSESVTMNDLQTEIPFFSGRGNTAIHPNFSVPRWLYRFSEWWRWQP